MTKTITDRRIAYRFSVLSTLQTRSLAEMYTRKYGLTVNSWWAMVIIGRFPKCSASNVVENTTLEPDKVSRAVDVLVEKGLVLRREDPEDRRRVTLNLSASGSRVFEDIETVRKAIEAAFLDVLSEGELDSLYLILDKLETRSKELFSQKNAWASITGEDPPVRSVRVRSSAAAKPQTRSRTARAR